MWPIHFTTSGLLINKEAVTAPIPLAHILSVSRRPVPHNSIFRTGADWQWPGHCKLQAIEEIEEQCMARASRAMAERITQTNNDGYAVMYLSTANFGTWIMDKLFLGGHEMNWNSCLSSLALAEWTLSVVSKRLLMNEWSPTVIFSNGSKNVPSCCVVVLEQCVLLTLIMVVTMHNFLFASPHLPFMT